MSSVNYLFPYQAASHACASVAPLSPYSRPRGGLTGACVRHLIRPLKSQQAFRTRLLQCRLTSANTQMSANLGTHTDHSHGQYNSWFTSAVFETSFRCWEAKSTVDNSSRPLFSQFELLSFRKRYRLSLAVRNIDRKCFYSKCSPYFIA